MCGIFGCIGSSEDASTIVLEGLKSLEYRGYDSWGVAVLPSNKHDTTPLSKRDLQIMVQKEAGKIGSSPKSSLPKGTIAIGHTRWATHGGATRINAHPHLDCTHQIGIIHNGIIENFEELKLSLEKKGHRFISETDSEVLAHLIEEYSKETDFAQAVEMSFLQLKGSNALIAMTAKEDCIVAAKEGSPLVIGFADHGSFIASDASALLPHTRDVHIMDDHEMAIITKKIVRIKNLQSGILTQPKIQHLDWDIAQAQKGVYTYFMRKEMDEQPAIIEKVASLADKQIETFAKHFAKCEQRFLIGCGSSMNEAMIGAYLFATLANLQSQPIIGSEFSSFLSLVSRKSGILAISQSGETMDILVPLQKSKIKGVKIFALVNVFGSTLYRLADEKILIEAGIEKSVASTKAFSAQVAWLILLSFAMVDKLEEGKDILRLGAKAAEKMLDKTSTTKIEQLAKKLKDVTDIFIIGRGMYYPLSLEAAIKIKETTYIHAEGLAAGELKHGPLALIQNGVPCIVFLPNDNHYEEMISSTMELKARGGYIIGVSFKPHAVFDEYIEVTDAKEGTLFPALIFSQLLAYHIAIQKNLDPDMPRNLAKSVTVG